MSLNELAVEVNNKRLELKSGIISLLSDIEQAIDFDAHPDVFSSPNFFLEDCDEFDVHIFEDGVRYYFSYRVPYEDWDVESIHHIPDTWMSMPIEEVVKEIKLKSDEVNTLEEKRTLGKLQKEAEEIGYKLVKGE